MYLVRLRQILPLSYCREHASFKSADFYSILPAGLRRSVGENGASINSDFLYLNVFLYCYIVTDVTPPVFMSCPSDIRASINVSSIVLVNWTEPVALDNGDLAPQVTVVPPGISPPHNFNKTTLVVYTARDATGNKKECSFKVVLEG